MLQKSFAVVKKDQTLIVEVLVEEIILNNVANVRRDFSSLEAIETKNFNIIILDVTSLSFLDSSGLGWLISLHQQFKNNAIQMSLVSNKQEILRIFRVTYLDRLINIYATIEEALVTSTSIEKQ